MLCKKNLKYDSHPKLKFLCRINSNPIVYNVDNNIYCKVCNKAYYGSDVLNKYKKIKIS